MSALDKFLKERKPHFCTCGMDDNMHETYCALYKYATARAELAQLRAKIDELNERDIMQFPHCQTCGGVMVFEADEQAQDKTFCPFCELMEARKTIAQARAIIECGAYDDTARAWLAATAP